MGKIALIKTEVLNTANFTVAVPLGPLYLAAAAREAGHEVRFFDLTTVRVRHLRQVLDGIAAFKPDLVGFSSMSLQFQVLEMVSAYLRPRLPRALFVSGGPLASSEKEDLLKSLPDIDAAYAGEAESSFGALCGKAVQGGSLEDVPGVYHRTGNEIAFTGPAPFVQNLDDLPMPDYSQIDLAQYSKFLTVTGHRYLHGGIATSRGCPYHCKYCHNIFGKHFRARSVKSVMDEIAFLHKKFNIRFLEIYDDIFNFDYGRATEIVERIQRDFPQIRLGFWNGLRMELTDEKFIRLLSKNTFLLAVPVESPCPETRRLIGRTASYEKLKEVLVWTRKYNIYTWGYFMLGFPGETRERMDLTIQAAHDLDIDFPILIQFMPFKHTALADMLESQGFTLPHPSSINYHKSDINCSEVPTEYIHRQRALLWRKTLMRRPRNWYQLFNLARWLAWWLGPTDLAWYVANSIRSNFFLERTQQNEAMDSFLEKRRTGVFGRLARKLELDQTGN